MTVIIGKGEKVVLNDVSGNAYLSLNDKLFVNYRKNGVDEVVSTYTSNQHVLETLTSSTFIPIMMNGDVFYKNEIMDGGIPFLFNFVSHFFN